MLSSLVNLLIVICLLYMFNRVVGQYLLPIISHKRFERYKRKFFEDNPHINGEKYSQFKQKQEENSSLIEKRKNFRI